MGRKSESETIEFCTMEDILDVAKEIYPNVKNNLDYKKSSNVLNKDNYRKKITATLNAHIQITQGRTHGNKVMVSKEIATFIVGELLCDYFSTDRDSASKRKGEIEEKRKKEQEERDKKWKEEYQKKSSEKDKQFREKEDAFEKELEDYNTREDFEKRKSEEKVAKREAEEGREAIEMMKKLAEEGKELIEMMKKLAEEKAAKEKPAEKEEDEEKVNVNEYEESPENLYNGVHISKCDYHIPYKIEDLDQTIDRMMLRALFDMFYDFDEVRFRKDYIDRNRLINDVVEPPEYGDGYSELTEMLEDPVRKYIFPRKKTVNKYGSELCIKVDYDTEARLKRYASENEITISEAISELLYSPESPEQTNESKDGSKTQPSNHKKNS